MFISCAFSAGSKLPDQPKRDFTQSFYTPGDKPGEFFKSNCIERYNPPGDKKDLCKKWNVEILTVEKDWDKIKQLILINYEEVF